MYNWDMKREGRRQRKLYIDIIAVIAVTVLLAVFFYVEVSAVFGEEGFEYSF